MDDCSLRDQSIPVQLGCIIIINTLTLTFNPNPKLTLSLDFTLFYQMPAWATVTVASGKSGEVENYGINVMPHKNRSCKVKSSHGKMGKD